MLVQLPPDTGWEVFKETVRGKRKGLKTIAVDTISGLYTLCMQHVCAANNWKHPADGAHGKGWDAVKREFMDGLQRLTYLADSNKATLVIIDHSKRELIETTTANIEKVVCAMSGQARGTVMPIPDHIWFLGYEESDPKDALRNVTAKRSLFVSGDSNIEAGCRDPKVKVKIITPLSKKNPYEQIVSTLYGKEEQQ